MKRDTRSKLKAASQEEILQKWKEDFKNQLGNPPEITDNPTEEIINEQLSITLRHFTED